MAFKKAKFGSKNPTGDKTFNKITKNVFADNSPAANAGNAGNQDDDADDAPPPKGATLSGGKSKGKGAAHKYDTATNTFKRC